MAEKRVMGFDVARAFCIIWIVAVYHVFPSAQLPLIAPIKTITYSSLGIFTFLSSFLLTSKYKFIEKKEVPIFYKKRFFRFYPLFFISSVVLCLIGYNTINLTIKGLLGISPFWKPHPTTMWYCAMLISLYCLTPFWSTGGLYKQSVKFALTMAIIMGVELLFHTVVPRTFCYFPLYFIGIVVAQFYKSKFYTIIKRLHFSVVSCSLYVIILVIELYVNNWPLVLLNSAIGILALLSFYMQVGEIFQKNSSNEKLITILSYSSMCMYLFHREIHYALLSIFKPTDSIVMLFYLGLLGLLITIFVSYYIQLYYDKLLKSLAL